MSTPAQFPHDPRFPSQPVPNSNPGFAQPYRAGHSSVPGLRISDQDRQQALEALGSHFAEGRLQLDEYEERASLAAEATTADDLNALFVDLPALKPNAPLMPMYSASEVERARINGGRPKTGIMLLTTIGSIVGTALLNPYWEMSGLIMFLIPAVAVLLYVLKIGPAEWHAPSQRSIERARLRSIRTEHRYQAEQLRAQRRQQRAELTSSAMDMAHRSLKRFQGPQR
ncbi:MULTISPECIES: DUF1707 SHOCT-like domain-containing protein [Corynebacterium]|uniref:DUF1707 SHOCT-like domain-containing protein n=1 Tax=Corynebacterium TaxID=1716 RepID=UPI0008D5FD83|nr:MULTISPECIES: DUF1707 domain-containing protein [Corynebacterium]MCX2162214.1 DUF1707 domain-containing protein [Corynebacterium auriscanis]OFT90141.1 hypothetical protein HMPREF3098_03680 [Corynebacterium sp. HMSC28B08]